jgi:hypothetical protein
MPALPRTKVLKLPALIGVALLLLCCAATAATQPTADALLREAVSHERRSPQEGYFAWMDKLSKPRGSVTKWMVSTPGGILSRVVAYNDRALTTDERRQDDGRIDRLRDPRQMRAKAARQADDRQHIERLLNSLPDGFRCQYAEAAEAGTLRLQCVPAPGFAPPNYESQVLQGMNATILIDAAEHRITRIEGTLVKDVNFGWGFLGRLNRGGRIEITQQKFAGGHWEITEMKLLFEGKLLMLKPLHIEENESNWEFRSVPAMDVPQALEYLRSVK